MSCCEVIETGTNMVCIVSLSTQQLTAGHARSSLETRDLRSINYELKACKDTKKKGKENAAHCMTKAPRKLSFFLERGELSCESQKRRTAR